MDTDNDSLLLLRLMVLAHIIHLRFTGKGLPWCFLEHPEDPISCARRAPMPADVRPSGRLMRSENGVEFLGLLQYTLTNVNWDSAWPNPLF